MFGRKIKTVSPRCLKLFVPVYQVIVLISINETDKQFQALASELGIEICDPESWRGQTKNGSTIRATVDTINGTPIIRFSDFKLDSAGINTLSHECYHLAERILMERGIYPSRKTSEAYAYMLGYLVEEIYNASVA